VPGLDAGVDAQRVAELLGQPTEPGYLVPIDGEHGDEQHDSADRRDELSGPELAEVHRSLQVALPRNSSTPAGPHRRAAWTPIGVGPPGGARPSPCSAAASRSSSA